MNETLKPPLPSRLQRAVFVQLLFALSMLTLPLHGNAATSPDLAVTGIQAHLLLTKTGQLSPDVLGTAAALNNVVAGENASTSTLVKVKLSLADPKRLPQQATVRLVATERGKRGARVVLDQSSRVGPFSAEGVSYVGFWLANTGCASISLRATVTAAKQSSALSSVIPFTCNE
jgi:hypothetical protein